MLQVNLPKIAQFMNTIMAITVRLVKNFGRLEMAINVLTLVHNNNFGIETIKSALHVTNNTSVRMGEYVLMHANQATNGTQPHKHALC